ncbi:MAG: hypothetical protein GY725_12665 [bacterium]|nr:hypothetical protein [bacterium]
MTRRLSLPLVLLLTLGALFSSSAQAQRQSRPLFEFEEWSGELAGEVRWDNDKREIDEGTGSENKRLSMIEELKLGFDGWVYHPAFSDISGIFRLEFEQASSDTEPAGSSQDTDRMDLGFNLSGTFLPEKPYPVTLFADKERSELDTPLAPQQIVDALRYGTSVNFREFALGDFKLPTQVSLTHNEIDSSGISSNTKRERDLFRLSLRNETDRTRSVFNFDAEEQETRSGISSASRRRHTLQASHDRTLDKGLFSSNLVWTENSSDVDSRALYLTEQIRLSHGAKLSSRYNYTLNYQDNSTSATSHAASAGLSHQLFDSLRTTVSTGGTFSDFDLGQVWSAYGRLDFDYNKKIPWGRLGLRFSPDMSYQDEDQEEGSLTVLDETQNVLIGQLIILNKTFVAVDSIVVTDPTTLFSFIEGIDYEVVPVGSQTGLRVIPGSNLDPAVPPLASTIEVDYDFQTLSSRKFSGQTTTSSISLDLLDHLYIEVSDARTSQRLISGVEEQNSFNDSDVQNGTVEFRYGISRTRFKYRRERHGLTPRDRYSLSQFLNFRLGRRSTFSLYGTFSHESLEEVNRDTDTTHAGATITTVLPGRILARLRLLGRLVEQEEEDTETIGSTLSFTYRYGRLHLSLEHRYFQVDTQATSGSRQDSKDRFNRLLFRVSRPF